MKRLWVIHSQTENLIGRVHTSFSFIGNGSVFSIPFPALIAALVVAGGHFVVRYTALGRYVYYAPKTIKRSDKTTLHFQ